MVEKLDPLARAKNDTKAPQEAAKRPEGAVEAARDLREHAETNRQSTDDADLEQGLRNGAGETARR